MDALLCAGIHGASMANSPIAAFVSRLRTPSELHPRFPVSRFRPRQAGVHSAVARPPRDLSAATGVESSSEPQWITAVVRLPSNVRLDLTPPLIRGGTATSQVGLDHQRRRAAPLNRTR